eukprot:TRINITY_DN160_c0_g1_i2.p1 TRINITY_DN160_c0_g1~~TRINITY_DN160_c0_g1_i2.p1  ORF type:complete len:119 (+),score=24.50 TRINITY_DN160_c0_g1_i2:652-1008(+)
MSLSAVKQKIDYWLIEVTKIWQQADIPFGDALWAAIDEVMDLVDTDVYSYKPDVEGGPFTEKGSIWYFNYFFYNRKLRRVLYFSCRCVSKYAAEDVAADDRLSDEDPFFANGMELEDE